MFKAQRKLKYLCISVIWVVFTILLWRYALPTYLKPYDSIYWQDRCDHSQWAMPLSQRVIGDDALFACAGDRLLRGESPTIVVPDKPPVALYLMGVGIHFLGNPAVMALIAGLVALVAFYFFSWQVLENKFWALIITSLLALDPMFFSQLWKAWLDLYMVTFLCLSLSLLVWAKRFPKYFNLMIFGSGVMLGLFFEVKMWMLLPVIFGLQVLYLIWQKKYWGVVIFCLGMSLAIVGVYTKVFLDGGNLVDVVKIHKYRTMIYLVSELKPKALSATQTLFTGQVPQVDGNGLIEVKEWSVNWALLGLMSLVSMVILAKNWRQHPLLLAVAVYVLMGFVFYTRVPFYARYLVIMLPFIYLLGMWSILKLVKGWWWIVVVGMTLIATITIVRLLTPDLGNALHGFYYNYEHRFFRDIYEENLTTQSRPGIAREEFYRKIFLVMQEMGIGEIKVTEKERMIAGRTAKVKLEVSYLTRDLGQFSEEKWLQLESVNNEWKVEWDWGLVVNDFALGDRVEKIMEVGKRGRLVIGGVLVAEDTSGWQLSVVPQELEVAKEEEFLKYLGALVGIQAVALQNAYQENVWVDQKIPLISLMRPFGADVIEQLRSYKGVYLEAAPTRLIYGGSVDVGNSLYKECCTQLYSSTNYRGVRGLEQEFDADLQGKNGGELRLVVGDKVKRVVIKQIMQTGMDVIY